MGLDAATLTAMVLATGALGTAAFGIVDGLKIFGLGKLGFGKIRATLGEAVMEAVHGAYGAETSTYLRALYLEGRKEGALPRTLRQGLRVGLTPDNALRLAEVVGVVDGVRLREAARKLQAGRDLEDEERGIVGRFELAIDSRIEAALVLADQSYINGMRVAALIVAVALALVAAATLGDFGANLPRALIVGLAAVPLAPIAKDLATALRQARTAVGGKP